MSTPTTEQMNIDERTQPHAEQTKHSDFHSRLNDASGTCSYRKLGKLTDTHPETVRRYMQGQAPSATFLTNMCRVLGISGEWLLTGRGPMKCTEVRSHALSQADPSELMTAIANTLTDLCDRMDRIERFVQTLETRVRGVQHLDVNKESNDSIDLEEVQYTNDESDRRIIVQNDPNADCERDDDEPTQRTIESKPKPADKPGSGAQRIRDAIAKRSS